MTWADMELDDDDKMDTMLPMAMPSKPDYPCGLRICLTHLELPKINLDSDCDIGDMVDLRCMAEVMSKNEDGNGCRIELQIKFIKKFEDEDTEED